MKYLLISLSSAVLLMAAMVFADDIPSGADSYVVKAATVTFDAGILPAGFFGVGSDPFSGTVQFQGPALPGAADTIVQRKELAPLPGPGSSDAVPIEILQMDLVSLNPITVRYNGGQNPEQWNVKVTLDPSKVSTGQMFIDQTVAQGGLFHSFFDVFVRIDFLPAFPLGSVTSASFEDSLAQNDCTWSHTPPLGFPSGTNFFPGGLPGDPGQLNHLLYDGGRLDLMLELTPLPEPATMLMVGTGLMGLLGFIRKSRGR